MSDAEQRAQRDAGALAEHLSRLVDNSVLPRGVVAGIRRRVAEQLVTWGWTHIGPGEQVVARPLPRDKKLGLREELAATIAGSRLFGEIAQPVALAEQLVSDGWVKLAAGERIVTPMSRAEAFETVRLALEHWEELKKTAKEKRAESAEVSSDASELTSSVKSPGPESLILAAFAGADQPLFFDEVLETAAGGPVPLNPRRAWDHWRNAFASLYDQKLIEALPGAEGEVKRYQLTPAGRSLHELDGVDL